MTVGNSRQAADVQQQQFLRSTGFGCSKCRRELLVTVIGFAKLGYKDNSLLIAIFPAVMKRMRQCNRQERVGRFRRLLLTDKLNPAEIAATMQAIMFWGLISLAVHNLLPADWSAAESQQNFQLFNLQNLVGSLLTMQS